MKKFKMRKHEPTNPVHLAQFTFLTTFCLNYALEKVRKCKMSKHEQASKIHYTKPSLAHACS